MSSANDNNAIEIKLVRASWLTRHHCHVCGGYTEKVSVLAEAETPKGTVRVRERCLKEGDLDAKAEAHAEWLGGQAKLIRELIGRLRVPSYSEWWDEMARADEPEPDPPYEPQIETRESADTAFSVIES